MCVCVCPLKKLAEFLPERETPELRRESCRDDFVCRRNTGRVRDSELASVAAQRGTERDQAWPWLWLWCWIKALQYLGGGSCPCPLQLPAPPLLLRLISEW